MDNNPLVYFENRHVCIGHQLVEKLFDNERVILTIYYPAVNSLLIAPVSEPHFKQIHKGRQQMLKQKNMLGDCAVSVEELLLDHEIDETSRTLAFECQDALRVLKVTL